MIDVNALCLITWPSRNVRLEGRFSLQEVIFVAEDSDVRQKRCLVPGCNVKMVSKLVVGSSGSCLS